MDLELTPIEASWRELLHSAAPGGCPDAPTLLALASGGGEGRPEWAHVSACGECLALVKEVRQVAALGVIAAQTAVEGGDTIGHTAGLQDSAAGILSPEIAASLPDWLREEIEENPRWIEREREG